MGKFEIFLLLLGVGLLAFFSQMPANEGAHQPVPRGGVLSNAGQANGSGEYEGVPVFARFSTDSFKIVDGDSVRISTADAGQIDLRLASIDAPELNQTTGRAAKKHLEEITAGRTATFLQTDTDRYQRAVVFMFVNGLNSVDRTTGLQEVNAQMVADGFAWHATKYSTSVRLAELEAAAKAKRLGLWAKANPQPPWEYRGRR